MSTRRTDVYDAHWCATLDQAAAACWRARLPFFSWRGWVYFSLGPGPAPDGWHNTGMKATELAP